LSKGHLHGLTPTVGRRQPPSNVRFVRLTLGVILDERYHN